MNAFTNGFYSGAVFWSKLCLNYPRMSFTFSLIGMAIFYIVLYQFFPTTALVLGSIALVLNIGSYFFMKYWLNT